MAAAVSAILCFGIAFTLVSLGLGLIALRGSDLLLRICLSAGFGLGLFSIIFFLARVSGFMGLWRIDFTLFALSLAAWLLFTVRRSPAVSTCNRTRRDSTPKLFIAGFLVALFAALYAVIVRALGHPYGSGWDSFAIWNLHARFLDRGGAYWRDGFSLLIPWSHPDYPLLLPAAIAHFWALLGHETPAVPSAIGPVFTFSTLGLLFSALDMLVGRTSALLAGMALLCTPSFIELGTWQYADVPLSFFFLGTIVLFHLNEHAALGAATFRNKGGAMALAGLAAGFAAWTKNEGVLFVCAMLVARLLLKPRVPSLSSASIGAAQLAPLLFTFVPVFCVLVFFKHFIAPPGDLFSDGATMLHKLRDPARYWAVTKWYGKEFLRFGEWLVIPVPLLMLGLYLLIRANIRTAPSASVRASALTLGLTLAGYFFVYLITPYEIYWHLRFSLARLFIQIWPSAIFVFFLGVDLESLKPWSSQQA
jgi:hypothetical protein